MKTKYQMTSESVSEGHPDKVADQISDAILDAHLALDPKSRVACECMLKSDVVWVAGEITSSAIINIEDIVRSTIKDIGYYESRDTFSDSSCKIVETINKQSAQIASGIDSYSSLGAGDQGIMVGYACKQTKELMPAAIMYSHLLMQRQAYLRKDKSLPWLLPDAKAQVTLEYLNGEVNRVNAVVLSTQHSSDISLKELREKVVQDIVLPVFPAELIDKETKFLVNPAGVFTQGGPVSDCGLTGRKNMVDTYGTYVSHGGGCFSGKDPTKVDRTAAYYARYVAKNIIAANLARECEIKVAYAIAQAQPVMLEVNTFSTGVIDDEELVNIVNANFDFTPSSMIK